MTIGLSRMVFGHLPVESLHHAGLVKIGHKGNGFLTGATLFVDGGMTLYPGFEDNG